jgi:hypothetical protein
MLSLPPELSASAITNLRHVIALLDLCKQDIAAQSKNVVYLSSARASVCAACVLLTEYPDVAQTRVSVPELIVKAELAVAMVELQRNDLSIRVAQNLLQETRVRIEATADRESSDRERPSKD